MESDNMAEFPRGEHSSYSPVLQKYSLNKDSHIYYVVMERLVKKLNDIEHELKCAWRILDILNQECIKMWERLEKLEGFLYEQQNIITHLVGFRENNITKGDTNTISKIVDQPSSFGELDTITRSLNESGNVENTNEIESTYNEKETKRIHVLIDNSSHSDPTPDTNGNSNFSEGLETLKEEDSTPDEAFYRSLNNAYREDLISGESSRPSSQLGMIWEEVEDMEDLNVKKKNDSDCVTDTTDKSNEVETIVKENGSILFEGRDNVNEEEGEVFSAADYKTYRGNIPCISEQDLAHLSRLNTMNEISLDSILKLNNLTIMLQKDSENFNDLCSNSLDKPQKYYSTDSKVKLIEEANCIDEQLRKIYEETDIDNWVHPEIRNSNGRTISKISTDSGLSTNGDSTAQLVSAKLNSSPKSNIDPTPIKFSSESCETTDFPEHTVKEVIQIPIDMGNFAKGYAQNKELTDLMVESLAPTSSISPILNVVERSSSPTLSGSSNQSTKIRQEGYLDRLPRFHLDFSESNSPVSPPPPAPQDSYKNDFITSTKVIESSHGILKNPIFVCDSGKSFEQGSFDFNSETSHLSKSSELLQDYSTDLSDIVAKSDSDFSTSCKKAIFDESPGSPKSSVTQLIPAHSIDEIRSVHTSNLESSELSDSNLSLTGNIKYQSQPSFDGITKNQDTFTNQMCPSAEYAYSMVSDEWISDAGRTKHNETQYSLESESSSTKKRFSKKPEDIESEYTKSIESTAKLSKPPLDFASQQVIYSTAAKNELGTIDAKKSTSDQINPLTPNAKYNLEMYDGINKHLYDLTENVPVTVSNSLLQKKRAAKMSSLDERVRLTSGNITDVQNKKFPTGNITDALSYYPTSGSLERHEYINDPWTNSVQEKLKFQISMTSNIEPITENDNIQHSSREKHFEKPNREIFHYKSNHQGFGESLQENMLVPQLSTSRQSLSKLSINQEITEKFYDASNVIVSQSGYISISTNIKEHDRTSSKNVKKIKRVSSLKNAMSSVSSWLPDLHLSRRYRSLSLPGEVTHEEANISMKNRKQRISIDANSVKSRHKGHIFHTKKKHMLVSTMSEILQKAKRKTHLPQSLSDPEQSETEWSSERQSGLSEDEGSLQTDADAESNTLQVFKSTSKNFVLDEDSPEQQYLAEDMKSFLQSSILGKQISQEPVKEDQENTSEKDISNNSKHQIESQHNFLAYEQQTVDFIHQHDQELATINSSEGNKDSAIFATVGDLKKCVNSNNEYATDLSHTNFPATIPGAASMEFAVSRALGKYRQRQSSIILDDPIDEIHGGKKIDAGEVRLSDSNSYFKEDGFELNNRSCKLTKLPESMTNLSGNVFVPEESPYAANLKSNFQNNSRFLPRHQQSLEIPWSGSRSGDGDEDNKSTHSYRSTSRISSRRQSTEDSIDSEDEWYCYELRKLEELERQSETIHETDMSAILVEDTEGEAEIYQPDEDIKEKMSVVLEELKIKTKWKKYIESPPKNHVPTVKFNQCIDISQKNNCERSAYANPKFTSMDTIFAKVTDYPAWVHDGDEQYRSKISFQEGSSSETSGPDSPMCSVDEDEYELTKDLDEQCSRRSSSGSTLRQNEKQLQGSDSLSRDGSVSVPASEISMSIPGAWDSETIIFENERNSTYSTGTPTATTFSLPKIKLDASSYTSSDLQFKDEQISPGLPGSKWKLLKALKERKAEEKLKEVEEACREASGMTQGNVSVSISLFILVL